MNQIDALVAAFSWEQTEADGRILFSHPDCIGSIVLDLASGMIVSFDERKPSYKAVSAELSLRSKYYDYDQSLQSKLLLEERFVFRYLVNRKVPTKNPFEIFPKLLSAYGMTEALDKGPSGWWQREYSLLETPEELASYKELLLQLATAEGDLEALIQNKMQILTGVPWSDKRFLLSEVHGGQHVWWHEALVRPVDLDGDDAEGRQMYCQKCDWKRSFMFWLPDHGDYMDHLYEAWQFHNQDHPDCAGEFGGF